MAKGEGFAAGFLTANTLFLKILVDIPGVNPLILMKFGGLTL